MFRSGPRRESCRPCSALSATWRKPGVQMHETGLAKKIASLAASHADSHGLTAAGVIRVRVGVWTCADPEHLHRDVQALRPENAPRIEIEIVEPRCVCE